MENKKVKKRLSKDQIKVMQEMKNNGKLRKDISLFFNISPQTVNRHVGYFGRKGRNKISPEIVEEIRELRKKGMIREEVAKRLGVSTATVSNYARGYGRTKCNITEEEIEEIRNLIEEGHSRREIAGKMNISYLTVSYYAKGVKPDINKIKDGKIVGYFSNGVINIVKRFEEKEYMGNVPLSAIRTLLKFFPDLNWISTPYGGRIAFTNKGKEEAFLYHIKKAEEAGKTHLSNTEIKEISRKFGIH